MASIPAAQKYTSTQEDVNLFLSSLQGILCSKVFDLTILPKKRTEDPDDPYTTANTMLALNYNSEDVVDRLQELQIGDYSETIIDDKGAALPPFFVFYLCISGRDIYIKVKIKNLNNNKIFCVSFHFAKYPAGPFPYRA